MLAVGLLVLAVGLLVLGHGRVRPVTAIVAVVLVGLATRALQVHAAARSLEPLAAPLAFLATAVPLAILLGRVGFFDAVALQVGHGRHLRPALWAFAAVVTTVLNLDASIVLLTPLYIRIARRHGLDPLLTAFQPVLLASLASSALPVSNLTNLIVAEHASAGFGEFLARLGPASLAATVVGWFAYARLPHVLRAPLADPADDELDVRRALVVGLPAVATLLIGFTLGDAFGVPAWAVAGVVVLGLMAVTRELPWRAIPGEAIVVAAGLAVLATAAAAHLDLRHFLGGESPSDLVRIAVGGIAGANAVNNLPALLVALPTVTGGAVWALLAGVNLGPVLWISGSLAGLLWMDIVRRHDLHITPIAYSRVGVRVGGPALLVAIPLVVLGAR